MDKETRGTYGLRDIKAIQLRCTRDACDGVERILIDSLEGHERRCPKCDGEFRGYFGATGAVFGPTAYYISLLVCIQTLVGIGPDAGEHLDYEVRLEYPVED